MAERAHEALIGELSRSLAPVRRLAPPWRRALFWLAGVAWMGLLLLPFIHMGALLQRLMGTPDMGLAAVGQVLTAVLAAVAAFETSVPGRRAAWALLPAPGVALWAGASFAGMMRASPAVATVAEPGGHPMLCIYVLIVVGLPLLALIGWLLRQACPLRNALTSWLAGLACAGAAATVLTMMHPFDANWRDLLAHLAAVATIVGIARLMRVA